MRWDFHGLTVEGRTTNLNLQERWQASYASRPLSADAPDLSCVIEIVPTVPGPPDAAPQFTQGGLLEYYLDGETAIAHFPRFGQLRLDLARGITEGQITMAGLDTYGVLEDLLAIALSPHLRRRGMFLIHAFAAAPSVTRGAVLIVGDIGAGKTTTGMALLNAGWRLLSNDSPILNHSAEALSYPGLLAAYPDTYTRFPATAHLSALRPAGDGRKKISVAAESIWPGVWLDRAPVAAIVFPQIEPRAGHALEPLRPPDALRLLLPHAIEQWDKAMIPAHLALLSQLVQTAPAYRLRLAPEVLAIPALLGGVIRET
jgi:hypothetical protein